jgi:hypothetical protein
MNQLLRTSQSATHQMASTRSYETTPTAAMKAMKIHPMDFRVILLIFFNDFHQTYHHRRREVALYKMQIM